MKQLLNIKAVLIVFMLALTGFSSWAKPGTLKRSGYISHGHTYYVSVKGDDAHTGTRISPLRTISAAANLAMAGDTILVSAGTYREQITPPRGGNSNRERIVYKTAPGEKVVIKGSEVVKGWKKLDNDTWEVKIPNNFFGAFNPYKERIHGDWFNPTPKDRKYHRGAVYLNGVWLMEAAKKNEVMAGTNEKDPLWWSDVDSTTTTIWAQFKDKNPNANLVEINVRPEVFYPVKPFINFITIDGFTMEQAATNWAPPTAEQTGLIGTHWSRGWIIENNIIRYSKCVGISLGKYGDQFDNKNTESAEGYVGTIKRALAFGWNKSTVGGHIVRNNTISDCEQAGIVGSMGCSFSVVEGNVIHDIYVKRLFTGAEMAAIKFHGAVDVQIKGNRIYRANMGVWLDWMAQGAQINSNLFYENDLDVFLEVDHGPMLVSNNVMLSGTNLFMNSSGAVVAHNLMAGKMDVISYDSRLTPFLKPHSTYVVGLHDNPSGDVQFMNNLFVNGGNVRQYSKALLPVVFKGNVYTKGAVMIQNTDLKKKFGEMDASAKEKMGKYTEVAAKERNSFVDTTFDAGVKLIKKGGHIYLNFRIDKQWRQHNRGLVSGSTLTKAIVPNLPFENPDGSTLSIDTDYFGKKRSRNNPAAGPFALNTSWLNNSDEQKIQLW